MAADPEVSCTVSLVPTRVGPLLYLRHLVSIFRSLRRGRAEGRLRNVQKHVPKRLPLHPLQHRQQAPADLGQKGKGLGPAAGPGAQRPRPLLVPGLGTGCIELGFGGGQAVTAVPCPQPGVTEALGSGGEEAAGGTVGGCGWGLRVQGPSCG